MALSVLVVTGGRADWSPLVPPLALMCEDSYFSVCLAVTGQHLAKEGLNSLGAIEAEGFRIDARIDMALSDDSAEGVTKSLGIGLVAFGHLLKQVQPDMVFVLGDRYELLAPVQAALLALVPVAHVAGGDVTEGAFDDAIRHSITKMSHLHFVTNAMAAARVGQLGERDDRIFNVGSPGLDRIRQIVPLSRDEFFRSIQFTPRGRNAIVTFHPETLSENPENDCAELLAALASMGPDFGLIFTGANADPQGRALNAMIATFVAKRSNAVMEQSLGSLRYISALTHVDLAVGNSSSGICEVPSFQIPTVNIGNRQKGRMRAASVIDCEPSRVAIVSAIESALAAHCEGVLNPYGDGHSAERIVRVLKAIENPRELLRKQFQDRVPAN